jgi:copper chaperone CopZ
MLTTYVDVCLLAAVWAKDIAERERMLREVAGVFRVLKKHNYSIEGEFKRMETKTFTVPNISCGGCTHTIEMKLGDMAGVTRIEADQRTQRVTVVWEEPATWEKIQSLLQEINYPAEGLIQLN